MGLFIIWHSRFGAAAEFSWSGLLPSSWLNGLNAHFLFVVVNLWLPFRIA